MGLTPLHMVRGSRRLHGLLLKARLVRDEVWDSGFRVALSGLGFKAVWQFSLAYEQGALTHAKDTLPARWGHGGPWHSWTFLAVY